MNRDNAETPSTANSSGSKLMQANKGRPHPAADHVELDPGHQQQHLSDVANQEQHEEGILESLKKYPKASFWCLFACWVLTLTGFENQAGGAVLGIPRFRQDFGHRFGDDFVLPAAWQSAFNAAPAATWVHQDFLRNQLIK